MDMSSHIQSQIDQAQSAFDLKGLDNLRQGALQGDRKALEKTAEDFEAIFVHMMLKSMRAAEDVLADESSPFNSQQVKFYRDMHDQQMATNLSKEGNLGLAELIVQQLDPQGSGVTPASTIRKGANLEDFQALVKGRSNEVYEGLAKLNPNNATANSSGDNFLRNAASLESSSATTSGAAFKKSAFSSPEEFVQSLLPVAQKVAAELGIEPKALVAQAAVETGWGQHMIHSAGGENSHNLFGIKAGRGWQGDKQVVETLEYQQGLPQKQKAAFRSYEDFQSSMQDYVQFVKDSPRYRQAVEQSANPEGYFKELQQAGYATDPAYADKVMSVYNSDKLNIASANNSL